MIYLWFRNTIIYIFNIVANFLFIIFYILTDLIASFARFVYNLLSDIPTVVAFGAIAGVMEAYFIMFSHSRIITLVPFIPFFMKVPAPIFLFIWFINQLCSGIYGIASGTAWWAHIFGFLSGMFLYKKFLIKRFKDRRRIQMARRKEIKELYYIAIGILIIHAIGGFAVSSEYGTKAMYLGIFLNQFFRFGSPIFMMVSGLVLFYNYRFLDEFDISNFIRKR